ncbi:hypothetical protein BGZ58_003777, partial [Dissophora ornata]
MNPIVEESKISVVVEELLASLSISEPAVAPLDSSASAPATETVSAPGARATTDARDDPD